MTDELLQFYFTREECFKKQGQYDENKHFFLGSDVSVEAGGAKSFCLIDKNVSVLENIVTNTIDPNDRNYYIIIPGDVNQKFKFDVDCARDILTDKEWKDLKKNLKDKILIVINNIFLLHKLATPSFTIDESSTEKKLSYHILINDIYAQNNCEAKHLMKLVKNAKGFEKYTKYVDEKVYSAFQQWRLRGSCKIGKTNFKQAIDDSTFEDSLPLQTKDSDRMKVLHHSFGTLDNASQLFDSIGIKAINRSDNDVSHLVDLIVSSVLDGKHSLCDDGNKNITYPSMRNILFSIGNAEGLLADGLKIFELYRKKSDYPKPQSMLEKMIDSGPKYGFTIASLHYWARENEKYKVAFPTVESESFLDIKDPYIWINFRKESDIVFKSRDDLYSFFLKNCPRVIAKIEAGKGLFVKKDSSGEASALSILDASKNFTDCRFLYFKADEKELKPPKIVNILFKNLFTELSARMKIYSTMTFKPNNFNLKEGEFNTWTGFLGKKISNPPDVAPIVNFISEVWAGGNEIETKYILDWFARKVQKPWEQAQTALVVITNQGSGKGTITDFMINHVFGEKYCVTTDGIGKGTQKHNGMIAGKLLWVVNEMKSDSLNFQTDFEAMKNLIDASSVYIEPKGIDGYSVPNYMDIIIFSNHDSGFIIEKSDRRYAIFQGDEKYIGDLDFFQKFRSLYFNKEMGDAFYTFLLNRDLSNVNIRKIPMTQLKRDMIELSLPSTESFWNDFVERKNVSGGLYAIEGVEIKNDTSQIKALTFYNHYVAWCREGNIKFVNLKRFGMGLKSKCEKLRTSEATYYILP